MRRTLLAYCALAATLGAAPSAPAQNGDAVASWAFIESVGGMAPGQPRQAEHGGWIVPIECDLTGLRKISAPPTVLNSTQVIKELRWRLDGDRLLLQLLLKPSPYATAEARCPALTLKARAGRELDVFYADGERLVPLGRIKLATD